MEHAYEEVKLCLQNNKHNISTESLQLCLEALRIVKDQKHNGYTNYPTWLVAAYISNNEEQYKFYNNLREDLIKSGEPAETAIGILAQSIQFQLDVELLNLETKCKGQIWSSILNDVHHSQINYYEVAKSFYEDG